MNTQIVPNQHLQETKFAEHKLQTNDIIIKFYETGFTKESEKIKQCGNFLEFALKENQITKDTKKKTKERVNNVRKKLYCVRK